MDADTMLSPGYCPAPTFLRPHSTSECLLDAIVSQGTMLTLIPSGSDISSSCRDALRVSRTPNQVQVKHRTSCPKAGVYLFHPHTHARSTDPPFDLQPAFEPGHTLQADMPL